MSKVVFGKRMRKSYAVTFYDSSGTAQTWDGNHGGPHVETSDQIAEGTERKVTKHRKQPPARYGNVIFHVEGVSNSKSDYGGHITVPKEFAACK